MGSVLAASRVADAERYAAVWSGVAAICRGSSLATTAAVLLACGGGPDEPLPRPAAEPDLTNPQEVIRQAGLIRAEMDSVQGASVLATVERGGQSFIELSSDGVASTVGRGLFSVDGRLEDGVAVTVYVPDDVVIPDGAVVEIVRGQHGYYFRSMISGEEP